MQVHVRPTAVAVAADWLIVCHSGDAPLSGHVQELDSGTAEVLKNLLVSGDFSGKCAETLVVHHAAGSVAPRIILCGLGDIPTVTLQSLQQSLNAAARVACKRRNSSICLLLPDADTLSMSAESVAECAMVAFTLAGHGQDLFKKVPAQFAPTSVTLLTSEASLQKSLDGCDRGEILGQCINLARELINRPPQEIFPEALAEIASRTATDLALDHSVLDLGQLKEQRMRAMLAVAQGSSHAPRLVVIRHLGGDPDKPTVALVGKGVTFDSGGLSMKTSEGMLGMKADMSGAATVLAVMAAVSRLKLPLNVVGYLGLVENMISGSSYRPDDVVTARNGITIEIQNTDAEGRLVLADVLSFAVDDGADRIVDLATLTGACVVALGEEVTGVFSNNAEWQQQILAAAADSGEDAWPLPMFPHYEKLLESKVADCRNIGGKWGGAITAAKFLEKFVSDKPWVHLDIAGPSFASSEKPHRDGGATGCMVRTLVNALSSMTSSDAV